MTFSEYQQLSRRTARYPDLGRNFIYPTLGLAGETGEVAEKIKKILRDKNGLIDETSREEIKKEMGDVLWYLAQLAAELNITLEDVAAANLKKLADRLERNQINGEGDDR